MMVAQQGGNPVDKLKRSKDRKVTNLVTKGGGVSIANTFGLPSGTAFSCPGATSVCETVCYAGKLEKLYKSVRENLLYNWTLLRDAGEERAYGLLMDMVQDFVAECDRRGADKAFRIHWDGDFFSVDYTNAWRRVIEATPEVRYWVYTRTAWAVPMLKGIPNLALYFSTDSENLSTAKDLREEHGVRLAMLAPTFAEGLAAVRGVTGRPAARCPENTGQVPLISPEGSACLRCNLCPTEKVDILFSATKR
jgi:hypothetical protein